MQTRNATTESGFVIRADEKLTALSCPPLPSKNIHEATKPALRYEQMINKFAEFPGGRADRNVTATTQKDHSRLPRKARG